MFLFLIVKLTNFPLYRLYALEKSLGSFWVGAQKIDGVWIKSTGEALFKPEVDVINDWTEGDCMIVDAGNDFKHKVVSCDLKFKVTIIWFILLNRLRYIKAKN